MIEQHPIYAQAEEKLIDAAKFEIFTWRKRRGAKLEWLADYCVTASAIKKYAEYISKKLNLPVKDVFKEIQGDIEYTHETYVVKDDDIFTDIVSDKQYTLDDIYHAFHGDKKEFIQFIKAYIKYKEETKED